MTRRTTPEIKTKEEGVEEEEEEKESISNCSIQFESHLKAVLL